MTLKEPMTEAFRTEGTTFPDVDLTQPGSRLFCDYGSAIADHGPVLHFNTISDTRRRMLALFHRNSAVSIWATGPIEGNCSLVAYSSPQSMRGPPTTEADALKWLHAACRSRESRHWERSQYDDQVYLLDGEAHRLVGCGTGAFGGEVHGLDDEQMQLSITLRATMEKERKKIL